MKLNKRKIIKYFNYTSLLLMLLIIIAFYSCNSYKLFDIKIDNNQPIKELQLQLLNSPSLGYLHPKVMDYLKQHKVFISLTTSPTRIKHLHDVFKTLDLRNMEKSYWQSQQDIKEP